MEVVGKERGTGTGEGTVGRGLREYLRRTIRLKDEMLASLNESVIFVG